MNKISKEINKAIEYNLWLNTWKEINKRVSQSLISDVDESVSNVLWNNIFEIKTPIIQHIRTLITKRDT